MITLFTDTDTDMTPAQAKEYGYRLISMPYSAKGKTVFPYEDFDRFDAHEFYQMLRSGHLRRDGRGCQRAEGKIPRPEVL